MVGEVWLLDLCNFNPTTEVWDVALSHVEPLDFESFVWLFPSAGIKCGVYSMVKRLLNSHLLFSIAWKIGSTFD